MAPAADIQQQVFDLLSRASNLSFITTDREAVAVSGLNPGQRVSAEVLATLPNNRAQVRVGTEQFNLDLPMPVRVGQILEMTFVSGVPRSTFAIARQAGTPPPVSLSDASRLLSLLITGEQIFDPELRASLQSIGNMLRRSSGETAVLSSLVDEALTYGSRRGGSASQPSADSAGNLKPSTAKASLSAFETSAGSILKNIAQNARFTLIEAVNEPLTPLPLSPGDEVNAKVIGSLPGGRAFVQVAGTNLELLIPHKTMPGEILRLTYLSAEPKPTFALSRVRAESPPPLLSEAGRWLSVLEHSEGGISRQQSYVLERLNSVLKSLPPGSPVFSAISDEPLTYLRSSRLPPAADMTITGATAGPVQPAVASGNGVELSDDMARLLQAVIKGNRLTILESINQRATAGSFIPGQQLRGEVLASLGEGRFSVMVAGQMLEFIMPKDIRRGDLINLFFISEEPHQTFLLVRFGRHGNARVSDTGRWLSGFMSEASANVPAQSALGILKTLLSEPTADAQQLCSTLQRGLRESGLFYEAHLARWFGGDFLLEDLLKEPQGSLSSRLGFAKMQAGISTQDVMMASVQSGSSDVMEAVLKSVVAIKHEGVAEQRTLSIVNEQLTALQSGQVVFRGDIFPGRHLQWSVAERDAGRNSSGERERRWDTSIAIDLPHLGSVTAQVVLDGTRIAVTVTTGSPKTAALLEGGRERLTEQIEGAGLIAAEVSITHVSS